MDFFFLILAMGGPGGVAVPEAEDGPAGEGSCAAITRSSGMPQDALL